MESNSENKVFPSLVAINIEEEIFNEYTSSGFIISENWIICNASIAKKLEDSNLVIRYGANDKFKLDMPTIQISNIVLHPLFDDCDLINNIALLKLKTGIDFNEFVQPIMLPWKYKGRSLERLRPYSVSLKDDISIYY